MTVYRFIIKIHRIPGIFFSILFLLFFLTGIVLIYKDFPGVKQTDRICRNKALTGNLPAIETILSSIPPTDSITGIALEMLANRPVFIIKTDQSEYRYFADSQKRYTSVTPCIINQVAGQWSNHPIQRIDTLNNIDIWIMYSRMAKEFPIYKIHFKGEAKEELYLSSRTGEALQYTDADSRFWAWIGAIPHWVYIVPLREDGGKAWVQAVQWVSGISCLVCLSGLFIGIRTYWRNRKRTGKWQSPYVKPWFKWHHITGFIFGLVVFTWMFSGYMSVTKVPQWFCKVHQKPDLAALQGGKLQPETFMPDYREVIRSFPFPVKRIEWNRFAGTPYYKVDTDQKQMLADASGNKITPFVFNEKVGLEAVKRLHHDSVSVSGSMLAEYDALYISRKGKLPLPVFRISVNDRDNSRYYIDPATMQVRYYNDNIKWSRWLYGGLHSFNIPWLVKNPWIWNLIMYTLLAGGIAVSITGIWLSTCYFKRKIQYRKGR